MRSCAFTGHRPKSFSWKYDETARECLLLKEMLKKEIEKLLDCGVTDFYSGLAEGVDTLAAQIVLAQREKNPILKLHCVLPCRDQAKKWGGISPKVPPKHLGTSQFCNLPKRELL